MKKYGYCRVSTPKQNIERQVRNIQNTYPDTIIVKEVYTGYDAIKGKEYLCFRDLLEASKLNQSQFGRAYGIPLRTVQNWCAGDEPQIYMLSLLAVAVFSNKEVANELRI